MKKAIIMYDDMVQEGESNEEFKVRTGWLRGFMKCYGLLLQRKASVAQRDLDQLINKLVSFVFHLRRIAMKHF